jgi:serine phosphatase RsbU (regulator of sigma subunit)
LNRRFNKNSHPKQTAAETCETVHDTLTAFRGNGQQADDITLVVIKKA